MGYFTWTLSNRKLERTYDGDFKSKCKLKYGGQGCVMCPDGTVIVEPAYDGYGIFDGKDVYELVVDWNRCYLEGIVNDILKNNPHKEKFYLDLAKIYSEEGFEEAQTFADELVDSRQVGSYFKTDWKRCLGIFIACEEENNASLPYPIKITNTPNTKKKYADLPPSISCQ